MKLIINVTPEEYEMLKSYAAAKRKHEAGKGFTIDTAIAELVSVGLNAISETMILDKNGNHVKWNTFQKSNETIARKIYRKY